MIRLLIVAAAAVSLAAGYAMATMPSIASELDAIPDRDASADGDAALPPPLPPFEPQAGEAPQSPRGPRRSGNDSD